MKKYAACLFSIGIAIAAVAAADLDQRHAWTTVGSTGVPYHGDQEKISTRTAMAMYAPGAPLGTARLRYNIGATDALVGLMQTGNWELKVAFRDCGPNDRVQAFLIRSPIEGRGAEVLLAFDSDEFEAEAQDSIRSAIRDTADLEFKFDQNVYHLAVIMTKFGDGAGPAFVGASLVPVQ